MRAQHSIGQRRKRVDQTKSLNRLIQLVKNAKQSVPNEMTEIGTGFSDVDIYSARACIGIRLVRLYIIKLTYCTNLHHSHITSPAADTNILHQVIILNALRDRR